MNTGCILAGRPCLGSWALYGLGTVNQNLPGFVVFTEGPASPFGGARNWGTGYMPATYQGTLFRRRPSADPEPRHARRSRRRSPEGQARPHRQAQRHRTAASGPATRNSTRGRTPTNWPSGCRPPRPEAVDLSKEPEKPKEAYGLNRKETAEFGTRCLLARRLVERGVRFVQVYCGAGSQWDAHADIEGNHTQAVPPGRPAHRRADQGPEGARPARRHAGDLGRRVRPHAR